MGKLIYMDNQGREIVVPLGPEAPVVSLGRATDCTIRSNRKSVSRRHAEFRYTNGGYEVVDLKSSNGTYLIVDDNRQPVSPRVALKNEDEVWCGDFILHFEDEEAFEEISLEAIEETPGPGQYDGGQVGFGAEPYAPDFGAQDAPSFGATGPPSYGAPSSGGVNFGSSSAGGGSVNFGAQDAPSFGATDTGGRGVNFGSPSHTPPPTGQPDYAAPVEFAAPRGDGVAFNDGKFSAQPFDPSLGGEISDPFAPHNESFSSGTPDYSQGVTPDPGYAPPVSYEQPPSDPGHGGQASFDPLTGEPLVAGYGEPASGGYGQPVSSPYNQAASSPYNQPPDPLGAPEPVNQSNWDAPQPSWSGNDDTSHDVRVDQVVQHLRQSSADVQPEDTHGDNEELARLKDQVRALEEYGARLADESEGLRGQLSQTRADLDGERGQREDAQTELERMREQLGQGGREAERLGRELGEARARTERLERELESSRSEAQRSGDSAGELEAERALKRDAERRAEDASGELERVRAELERAQAAARQIEGLRADVSTRDRKVSELEAQLDRMRQDLESVSEDLERARSASSRPSEDVETTRRELERHKRLLDEFERRNREMHGELDKLERSHAELKTERDELVERTEASAEASLQRAREVSQLTTERDALTTERDNARAELKTLRVEREITLSSREAALEERDSARAELSEVREAQGELSAQLSKAREQLDEQRPMLRDLRNEVEGLRQRLRLDKERYKTDEAGLKAHIAELEVELAAASEVAAPLEVDTSAFEAELAEAFAERDALHARLAEAEAARDALVHELRDSLAQTQELQALTASAREPEGLDAEAVTRIIKQVGLLERVVDAIERADISQLGTVDRVRLQSAIRGAPPAATLATLRAIVEEGAD